MHKRLTNTEFMQTRTDLHVETLRRKYNGIPHMLEGFTSKANEKLDNLLNRLEIMKESQEELIDDHVTSIREMLLEEIEEMHEEIDFVKTVIFQILNKMGYEEFLQGGELVEKPKKKKK